jgi:voltage-gated sodium channel
LLSVVPSMRKVIEALLTALPGIGSIAGLILLIFYVSAVLTTNLFGASFPQWFGTIGESMYSLFQIMTLEGWSDGIVRPVMEVYPSAWLFFVPFILITSFAVLNLFIGIIVDAMQSRHQAEVEQEADEAHDERAVMLREIKAVQGQLLQLTQDLASLRQAAEASRSPTAAPGE